MLIRCNIQKQICPIVLNKAFSQFVKSNPDFKSIIPVSCGLYENTCSHSCFTQRLITVSHSRRVDDYSKVSYRVIARTELADKILLDKKGKQYIITPNKEIKSICPYSQGDTLTNAFVID